MEIETRQFGNITIEEDKIITVPKGIPGFPGMDRYILLDHEAIRPFVSLQSVEDGTLAFYLMDPFLFKPDYKVDVEPYIKEMKWEQGDRDKIFVYVILNVADNDPKKITANLIGPLLINIKKNQAVQMLLSDKDYTHKFLIFGEEQENSTETVE